MSLHQTFVHCGRFSTAASRRSMARVAVPFLGVALSRPLSVIALVSHYLTNKLIDRRPFQKPLACLLLRDYGKLPRLSTSYAPLLGMYLRVTKPFAAVAHASLCSAIAKCKTQRPNIKILESHHGATIIISRIFIENS